MISDKLFKYAVEEGIWSIEQAQENPSADDVITVSKVSLDKVNVGPNSVDVTLGYWFLIPPGHQSAMSPHEEYTFSTIILKEPVDRYAEVYDVLKENNSNDTKYVYVSKDESIILNPGACLLGIVRESFDVSAPLFGKYYTPRYNGRSTLARMFLQSHMTAGEGDYGFDSAFVLELHNNGSVPIVLRPEMRIGQVYFEHTEDGGMGITKYDGYSHKIKPVGPRTGPDRA